MKSVLNNFLAKRINTNGKRILTAAFVLFALTIDAQVATSTKIGGASSRWTFGGGASLGFSGGSGGTGTTIGVSPRVGYLLTDNLDAGLATGFTWGSNSYYSSTMFNVGPYINYYFARNFYLSGLFQQYFINQKDKYNDLKYSTDESALYFGGGYMQRIGNHAYMQIGAMYNVLYKDNDSIFSTGFMPTFGIVFGI